MKLPYLHRMLLGLVVITAAVLLLHRYAMNTVLRVDGRSTMLIQAVDDSTSGGKSVSHITRDNGKLILDCDIKPGSEWPFCEVAIMLKKSPQGVDLSGYNKVRLWLSYQGPEKNPQVRFFLRNFDPSYSKVEDATSLKVNEIAYDPARPGNFLEMNLPQFTVASWWVNSHAVPVEKSGTEITNVSVLEVSTGGSTQLGAHRIVIDGIEFEGKLLSSAALRLIIIATWIGAVLAYLVVERIHMHRQLKASDRRQLSLARINESLRAQSRAFEELARHDPLTGILNRKGLVEALLHRAENASDRFFPLSLIFIDIDHFKRINDQYGHSIGDQVIKDVATVVRNHIQRDDLLSRWGGEEFLLICPHTGGQDAVAVAERLRHIIATTMWPLGMHVTGSFGVSEVIAGEDLNHSIERADKAMYTAKQNGRDRVEARLPEAA